MSMRTAALLVLLFVFALATSACTETSEPDDEGCPAEGAAVDGLQGIVLTPNCAAALSDATVTAQHGTGAVLTVQTNAQGEFAIPASQLDGNLGRWRVSASKGPFSTPPRDITVGDDGRSTFFVLQAAQ